MRTEKMRQDNIRKVYGASAELFANFGVVNTNLETIAEKAGVSLRSVVNYFGKKEKLIKDMRFYFVNRATETIMGMLQKEEFLALSGKEKTIEIINLIATYAKEKYLYVCALIEMRALEVVPKMENDEVIPPIIELDKLLKEYLSEGKKDGSVRADSNFEAYIPLLIITIKGMISQYCTVLKDKDAKSIETFEASFKSLYSFLDVLLTKRL